MKDVRARHFDYNADGIPVVRSMPSATCADSKPNYMAARHVSFGTTPNVNLGLAIVAHAWECCDYPSDAFVLEDCWPIGEGPGLPSSMGLYLGNVASCVSAEGTKTELVFNGTVYTGSVDLRGGTLDIEVSCDELVDPSDPGKFTLTYSGCGGESGSLPSTTDCLDPVVVSFGQATFQRCCECNQGYLPYEPTTDVAAEISFTMAGGCRSTVFGRHVGYKRDAAGAAAADPELPLIAIDSPCDWNAVGPISCESMTCPVIATIIDVSDCAAIAGEYPLDYVTVGWTGLGPDSGSVAVTCTSLSGGLVQLDLTVICGVDHTGGGTIIISATDLENLDVTFEDVEITGPDICTGDCSWTWNEMAGVWELGSDTCSETCDECANSPSNPPASPVDQQVHTESCSGSSACCVGTIDVRVMRA